MEQLISGQEKTNCPTQVMPKQEKNEVIETKTRKLTFKIFDYYMGENGTHRLYQIHLIDLENIKYITHYLGHKLKYSYHIDINA